MFYWTIKQKSESIAHYISQVLYWAISQVQGSSPSAFIVFECLETLMKHNAHIFEIASQPHLGNKRKWKYSLIFHMLLASFQEHENFLNTCCTQQACLKCKASHCPI